MRRNSLIASCFALVVGLAGCDAGFDSQMLLNGYRVIGIEASPPEVQPDSVLEARVHDFYDGKSDLRYNWTLCLDRSVGSGDYSCSNSDLEIDLGGDADLAVDLGADGLDIVERFKQEDLGSLDGARGSRALRLDLWLLLTSGPDCRGCQPIESAKRLMLTDGSEARNSNPVIQGFRVEGTLQPGETLRLHVETDRPELYRDDPSGEERREEYLYSWYTSEGETSPTRSFGEDTESELRVPEDTQELEVVVAVRDGRGGLAVERKLLRVP